MEEDEAARWRRTATQAGALIMAMQDFAIRILRRARRGHPVDDAALAEIRAATVRYLKNLQTMGLAIEDEADIIGQALEQLDQLIDTAIRQANELEDD
jgi:hypothetical protein